jgi:UDP-N-acetyl-D-glucosamine dehydrogenase
MNPTNTDARRGTGELPEKRPVSIAPDGTVHPVPSGDDARSAFEEIALKAEEHRRRGGQVVLVQGLGFVGAAVAATIADAKALDGAPAYFVIGIDLPTPGSYWKVEKINAGLAPIDSTDPVLARLTHDAVHETANLRATTCEDAYGLADVIVVDVHLDVAGRTSNNGIHVELEPFREAIRTVGRLMRPDALVVVETTVPPGTCENVVLPVLREERLRRGIEEPVLLAHAYERVMPGPNYVSSIRSYPRTYSGVDERSSNQARAFLATFVDSSNGDLLWRLENPLSSELGKLLENSYRAANIAFIHEWTLLAEKIGVNLFEIIDSIRVRTGTHDNMRYPGFGVGGYCLTKDSLLAQWGVTHLLESDAVLETTLDALRTNALMPMHAVELVKEVAPNGLGGARIAVCGVSYVPDVADTRNSPTEALVDALLAEGAELRVHDPSVRTWLERADVPIVQDLEAALADADGVVLAVGHRAYRELAPRSLTQLTAQPTFVVDAQNVLSDESARELHAAGWLVVGVGKGHWRRDGMHRRK